MREHSPWGGEVGCEGVRREMAEGAREVSSCRGATVPAHVLEAIYGKGAFQASESVGGPGVRGDTREGNAGAAPATSKEALYETSLRRWWSDYAARKGDDDEEEYLSNSLLYDKNTLPRSVPAPVFRDGSSASAPPAGAGR